MGCWDCSCIICGLQPHNLYVSDEFKKISEWLNHCTLLTLDNKVYHNYEEHACNISFRPFNGDLKSNEIEYNVENIKRFELESKNGLFLHDDCFKYIKLRTSFEIKYNNVSHIKVSSKNYDLYGIKHLVGQFFEFGEKDTYMITSPLSSKKNANRINKVLSKYKLTKSELSKNNDRVSVPVSASLIEKNIIMVGNDNNLYINKDKWIKIPDTSIKTITSKIPEKNYKNFYYRGEATKNTSDIFILDNNSTKMKNGKFKSINIKIVSTDKAFLKNTN